MDDDRETKTVHPRLAQVRHITSAMHCEHCGSLIRMWGGGYRCPNFRECGAAAMSIQAFAERLQQGRRQRFADYLPDTVPSQDPEQAPEPQHKPEPAPPTTLAELWAGMDNSHFGYDTAHDDTLADSDPWDEPDADPIQDQA